MATGALATVYFHGQPGGAQELALFGEAMAARAGDWLITDRAAALGQGAAGYLPALARQVEALAAGRPLRLVGFSLGADVALRVAALLGGSVVALDCISAAAPSLDGSFPDGMAGKPVFTLAAKRPRLFGALTAVQGVMARVAPGLLTDQLFASAAGGDAALAAEAVFRAGMARLLREGLRAGAGAYRADVRRYATTRLDGFVEELAGISAPISFWHGDADSWAPLPMVTALAERLPGARLRTLPGLAHYSTLAAYLAQA